MILNLYGESLVVALVAGQPQGIARTVPESQVYPVQRIIKNTLSPNSDRIHPLTDKMPSKIKEIVFLFIYE